MLTKVRSRPVDRVRGITQLSQLFKPRLRRAAARPMFLAASCSTTTLTSWRVASAVA